MGVGGVKSQGLFFFRRLSFQLDQGGGGIVVDSILEDALEILSVVGFSRVGFSGSLPKALDFQIFGDGFKLGLEPSDLLP